MQDMFADDIRLHHDYVLIECDTMHNRAIIVSRNVRTAAACVGTVRRCSDGKMIKGKIVEMEVKSGDRVYYQYHDACDIRIAQRDYMLLPESAILGVIDENK